MGRSIWLTLFDLCMTGLLDVDAKDFYLMGESMQMYKLNSLVSCVYACLSPLRKVNETGTPTTASFLDVLH